MSKSYLTTNRIFGIITLQKQHFLMCIIKRMMVTNEKVENGDKSPKKVVKQFEETKKSPLSTYAFPIICFLLGTWQLYRYNWREKLISACQDNINGPVYETLPKLIPKNMYKRVRLEGEYLFDQVAKVGPCQYLNGCTHDTIADFHIYVPFKLRSNGKTIFVDMGILRNKETPDFKNYCEYHKNDMTVDGYVRRLYMPTSITYKFLWLLHDYGQYYIQRATSANHTREDGEPLTYLPQVDHYNMHTEYFLFWYILSAILFISVYRARM